MAKSHTRKKYNKKSPSNLPPEVRQITNLAADYIKHWTNKELERLHRERKPVCIGTKTGYKVGTYTLTVNRNKTCALHDRNNEFVHLFDNKINAILYSVYIIKNQLKSAEEILVLDQEINKNSADIMAMRHVQSQAKLKKEFDIVDIRQARLEIAEKQLATARDKISKIHIHAKYNKVWE